METRELRYFVAVAEELHFARAAARVGIEQPPLSKAIAALEHRLGVQLFVRTRRSTTLTAVGEMLLHDARRILAEVDCAQRNIQAAACGCSGRLRISVCDGAAHPRLARLLAGSRQDDPGVEIQIVHSSFSEQTRGLRVGTFDVAFALKASSDRDIESLPLWKDRAVIALRADHQLCALKRIERIESGVGPLLLLGEASSVKSERIETWLQSSIQCRERVEYVSSIELLLTLVAAGYGTGIISAAQAEMIHRPDLVLRPLGARDIIIETFFLQRSECASKLVSRFRERALEMAGRLNS